MKQKMFIANWKMNMTTQESLVWCRAHKNELQKSSSKIIICPSFPALVGVCETFKNTTISIAAQSCSEHKKGAFTGQVSAQDLADIGCSFVIVGHSEERALGLSNITIAQKTASIIDAKITPIVCIGESQKLHDIPAIQKHLKTQLAPLLAIAPSGNGLYITYEPLWAIGSGNTPFLQDLSTIFTFLHKEAPKAVLLYGGSVNKETIKSLQNIPYIQGFLIGSASLNFDEFKLIIDHCF